MSAHGATRQRAFETAFTLAAAGKRPTIAAVREGLHGKGSQQAIGAGIDDWLDEAARRFQIPGIPEALRTQVVEVWARRSAPQGRVTSTVFLAPDDSLEVQAPGGAIRVPDAGNDGVRLSTTGITVGDISNAGTIETGRFGIGIWSGIVNGSITNQAGGTLTTGSAGVLVDSSATVTGDIANAGTLGAGADGIVVSDSATVQGGIRNAAGGSLTAAEDGIDIHSSATVTGDIVNGGAIDADSDGVLLYSGARVGGSIINQDGGTISAGGDGILLSYQGSVGGDILNNGIINATTEDASDGIILESNSSVDGDIVNNGEIHAGQDGIYLGGSSTGSRAGNITNSGLIEAAESGIELNSGSSLTGAITNSGSIAAESDGIYVTDSTVAGGITNTLDGTIEADDDGIDISWGAVIGTGVTNAGTITARDSGIEISSGATINGALTNSGTIEADWSIYVSSSSTVTGGISNSGTLTGALEVWGGDGVVGGIDVINSGLIDIGESESLVSGDFTQLDAATLAIKLMDFAEYDYATLEIFGDVTLDGDLALDLTNLIALPPGLRFALIAMGGERTGTFDNYADGAVVDTIGGRKLYLTYTTEGDVELYTDVPLPGSIALLGIGALGWRSVRRCRAE